MLSLKVLFERATGRILGAQAVGFDGVDKRMDVLATAMRFGARVQDLTRLELCYAPPFGSAKDPVNMAGFVGENLMNGTVRQFHWSDVADLPRDGSVQLVDVRTPAEYARGHIEGFVNLPLDGLRGLLDKLDPAKPVYVHCHSGLRSYIACRLLTGEGFTCYNLAGGYRLWAAIQQAQTPVGPPLLLQELIPPLAETPPFAAAKGGVFQPRRTSSSIITTKPSRTERVPAFCRSAQQAEGMSSRTETRSIAPAAKASSQGIAGCAKGDEKHREDPEQGLHNRRQRADGKGSRAGSALLQERQRDRRALGQVLDYTYIYSARGKTR